MISVIVPAFNRADALLRTIKSILRQTFADFEIIVVDDASTDGTEDAVRSLMSDSRVRYERLERNGGVHTARNRGLDIARGEFVMFFDSDDELYPHALEKLHAILRDHPDFGIASAPYELLDGTLTALDREEGEVPFDALICETCARPHRAGVVLYRRSAIGNLRWFERNLDFVFGRRVAARTRHYYIPEPLARYHTQHGGSPASMTAGRRIPNLPLSVSRARVIADYADDFRAILTNKCPRLYGYYAYGAAVGLLLEGDDARRARNFAYEAFKYQPRVKYAAFYVFALLPGSSVLLHGLFLVRRGLRRL